MPSAVASPLRTALSPRAALYLALSITALLGAIVLALLDVEPITTWFYIFAWYPTLLVLDTLVGILGGKSLLKRPKTLLTMLWWSAIIWFLFETFNFRLKNWYYVFLPSSAASRWTGTILSFATVVPAIVLAERLLDRLGVWRSLRAPRITVHQRDLIFAMIAGLVMLTLVIAFPLLLFPLVWGAVWGIAEPALYRADPGKSLFRDIELGRWGRIARLMTGGLAIGLLWETFNSVARTQWIYTIPYLENLKIFEMPPYGFLGFPPFALEAWTLYHLLRCKARTRGVLVSAGFMVLALAGMERWTYSSTTPRLADLPGAAPAVKEQLRGAGLADLFQIARTEPATLSKRAGLSSTHAETVRESARLATLRGIGTAHAAALVDGGIATVDALGAANPDTVYGLVRGRPRPTPAEVRVWVRAARELGSVSEGEANQ